MLRSIISGGLIAVLSVVPIAVSAKEVLAKVTENDNTHFVLKTVTDVKQVAQLTGANSINKTDSVDVYGTDLGSTFNAGNRTYFVFGDTFGPRPPGMTGGGGGDWRSNTMAYTTDKDPSKGLKLDGWITDGQGYAKELLPSSKVDNQEITKIPTNGVSIGKNLYLFYMSVKHWGDPGEWTTNYSGIAKSSDQGKTWRFVPGVKWPGGSNFIQVSAYKVRVSRRLTEIYFWCIPAGRFGGVKLMRVNADDVEDITKYQYFAGVDEHGKPIWSNQMIHAKEIVKEPVGELSVIWDPYLHRWIMMYLQGTGDVVMREGVTQWGPWSKPISVMTQAEYPGLYGPFMNPKYIAKRGKVIYFTISRWGPYNVFWMKATLVKK